MYNKIFKVYNYIYIYIHNLGHVEVLSENAINSQLILMCLYLI
jgi:hypothetical protein